MLVEERQYAVVQEIACGQRGLVRIEFGESYIAVRVDGGLLIELPYTLDVAHIAGVLCHEKRRVRALYLAVRLTLLLGVLKRLNLRLGEDAQVLGSPFFETFEP